MAGWLAKSLCCRIDNLACTRAYLGSSEDVLDGLRDLGANAVTLDQADKVVALVELLENVRLNGTVCRCRRCRSE